MVEFFILEDLKPLLSRIYTFLNSMGGSSSKEPEKATEVGPPTKQMKDSPTINTQGGLHLFSMTGSPAGALLIGSLFVLSLLAGYKIYKSYKRKTREARVRKRDKQTEGGYGGNGMEQQSHERTTTNISYAANPISSYTNLRSYRPPQRGGIKRMADGHPTNCLLYTSDAADE